MTIRTSEKTVTFRRPFVLGEFEEVLPAGDYRVETDEELLEGISFPAYRRILTLIHLHANPEHPGRTQTMTIDPNELDAALERDQAPIEILDRPETGRPPSNETPKSDPEEADRRALERGEEEGMVVHPR